MSSASRHTSETLIPTPPWLVNGERMGQQEFHRRYLAISGKEKWELVGGEVYMASPLRWGHALYHVKLASALDFYATKTPGTEVGDNATTILSEESEPQPDLALRLLPEYGGRSRITSDQYVQGPPELIVEIAFSTRDLDMHSKWDDYQKAGVIEYLVLCVEEQQLFWTHFPSGKPIRANQQGVFRSRVFPGLWIHGGALLARDSSGLMKVLQKGLCSPEHTRFVKRLQTIDRRRSKTALPRQATSLQG